MKAKTGIKTEMTEIRANNQRIEALEQKTKANEININMLSSHRVEPEVIKAQEGETDTVYGPKGA